MSATLAPFLAECTALCCLVKLSTSYFLTRLLPSRSALLPVMVRMTSFGAFCYNSANNQLSLFSNNDI